MNDKPLYDLLAKAQLHPKSLTAIERIIWWMWNINDCDDEFYQETIELCQTAAAELEQFQQATEVQRVTVWLEEAE